VLDGAGQKGLALLRPAAFRHCCLTS